MSWNVYLEDPVTGETLTVEHHEGEGGTYKVGGSDEAELNITYNYSSIYRLIIISYPGLKELLHEKKAGETIPTLEYAVYILGTNTYEDYWAPTPGNAGHALNILLQWARQHPQGIWRVT